jgi:hypothetical protein
VWSLGIILYVLLHGKVPFDDKSIHTLHDKIKEANLVFPKSITPLAQELLSGMITPIPSGRIGLSQVINSRWVNLGYKTKVDNYMGKRSPLTVINRRFLRFLKSVTCTQFPDLEKELYHYITFSEKEESSLEKVYWGRRPSISLYYMILENFGIGGDGVIHMDTNNVDSEDEVYYSNDEDKSVLKSVNAEGGFLGRSETTHNFVNFLFTPEKNNSFSKYYVGNVFIKSDSSALLSENADPISKKEFSSSDEVDLQVKRERELAYPIIKKSIIKGIFKGIRAKRIKNQDALKKVVLEQFSLNNVVYEIKERNYICTIESGDSSIAFKVSLYFNVILRKYYLSITKISGDRHYFNRIREKFSNAFKGTSYDDELDYC